MFNNMWISIEPEHYIWDVLGDGQACIMLIMSNSYDFALMGQPLFQGYYTHHHMDNKFMSFGPLVNGGAAPLIYGDKPITPISQAGTLSPKEVIVLVIYISACLAAYYYLAYPYFQTQWDTAIESEKRYFDAAVYGYGIVCYLFYHYFLGPALGINTGSLLQSLLG